MKTSSFRLYFGDGRISIARYPPRDTPAGFRVYRALAPGSWFNSVGYEEYVHRFTTEILGPLDPATVWNELHALTAPYEPVLLCWEKLLTEGEYCHRRMVAEWFEKALNVEVSEIRVEAKPQKKTETNPSLFDTEVPTSGTEDQSAD